jgi:hypothetical protein
VTQENVKLLLRHPSPAPGCSSVALVKVYPALLSSHFAARAIFDHRPGNKLLRIVPLSCS